jgi:hypothetical protein
MQAKKLNIQPAFVPVAVANLLNTAVTSLAGPTGFTMTQPFLLVTHIRLINIDGIAHVVSLFKGATGGSAAGTQFAWGTVSVPANSFLDWYSPGARFDSGDFLTGVADLASKVIINVEAEISLS